MNKPLGCLTGPGIMAALVTLLLTGGISLLWGGRLFSPGALNAQVGKTPLGGVLSHAQTGGRCSACHAAPWSQETMSDRCLACHTDVTAQFQDPTSLHGALKAVEKTFPCQGCHVDHRGAVAQLTVMDSSRFPHQATGYALQGHRKTAQGTAFSCQDCHPQKLSLFDVAICDDCHRQIDATFMQEHVQAYGTACLPCHDGLDTYGKQFNHNKLAFPLTGKHASIACASCHMGARTPADFRATPQTCYACHQKDDAHQGQLGQDCAACHTTTNWTDATFDHSKTTFPLTGAHVKVQCSQCHVNNVFLGTPTDCFSCHKKDDAHQGQFGQDCGACHTTDNWTNATFDHSKTAFPLTGAHLQLQCSQCHVNNVFKGTPTDCVSCHPDPDFHKGLLGTNCAACHTTTAWSPAQFNQPHPFPFDHGSRGPSPCLTCHPNNLTTYTCYGCHAHDPARIAARHQAEGILDFQNCVQCHPTGRGGDGGGD